MWQEIVECLEDAFWELKPLDKYKDKNADLKKALELLDKVHKEGLEKISTR